MIDKQIQIEGVVTLSESETEDDFNDKFIAWIESNNWTFGGGIKDVSNDLENI